MPVMNVDLRIDETLRLSGSGSASIRLVSKSGRLARLEVTADESIRITPPASGASVRDMVKNGIGPASPGA